MTMARSTVIGRGVRVRGRVIGDGELTVAGHVEGDIAVSGDVTIEAGALVGADVRGRIVTVRGAVRGNVSGEEAVRLEEGARVVGDLHAPRVAIARGGLVRGHVQTSTAERPTRVAAPSAARVAPAPARRAAADAAPVARQAPAPPARAVAPAARPASRTPAVASTLAGGRGGPPPPTVPSLKKGAKGALKKKGS
jgi:cytoskeletal protein CcmA (bactofilin family)